jgi:hypothetical protein
MKATIALALLLAAAGCSGNEDIGTGAVPGTGPGDAQTPPTGGAKVEAWLAGGAYKSWHCEPAPHAARPVSGHAANRICSNDLLSAHGDGEYPVGAAAVKELYEQYEDGSTRITGYAVYLHVKPGGGGTYYWYERAGDGVFADGLGVSGSPKDTCVACHQAAGTDATRPGHDLVYTQVR